MRSLTLFCLVAILTLSVAPIHARPDSLIPDSPITISGTVTGPGGPVAGVWIGVGSPQDWQETTTNAGGFYSVTLQTDGQVWFHVRPDLATRLTQANRWRGDATADFTQNFTLTNGFLLDVGITVGGAPLTEPLGLEVQPLIEPLRGEWWYQLDWDEATQRQRAVLPPDVYYVTAHNPPAGYLRHHPTLRPARRRPERRPGRSTPATSIPSPTTRPSPP